MINPNQVALISLSLASLFLSVHANAADKGFNFDNEAYRKHIQTIVLPETEEGVAKLLKSQMASKETDHAKLAAICYLVRKRTMTGDPMSLENQKRCLKISNSLWRMSPSNLELLNLRLRYSLFPEVKRAPFCELAYPIAMSEDNDQVHKEIRNSFYLWLYGMTMSIETALLNKQKGALSTRTVFLFGNTKSVTKKDIAIWCTMVLEYAKTAPMAADKWKTRAANVRKIQGDLKLPAMTLEDARIGLAVQTTINLSFLACGD